MIRLTIAFAAVLALCSCSRDDVARASSYAAEAHAALDQAQAQVETLKADLAQAKIASAALGDVRSAQLVGQLEQVVTTAEKYIPALQTSAKAADDALAKIKDTGDGEVPWWKVAVGIAVPLLLPLAKGIPGVGPVIGSLGELAWTAYSTHETKVRQATIEAEAKALPDQVAVAHAALSALPVDVARDIKSDAFSAQASNDTLAAIRPHVLAVEAAKL